MADQANDFSGLLGIAAIIVFFVLVFLLIRYAGRKRRQKLEPLAMALGGSVVGSIYRRIYLQLQGAEGENQVELVDGGEDSPPALLIRQMTPLGFNLDITQENIISRKIEQIGLLKEVKVGDPIFDDKYLIRSKNQDQAMIFLGSSTRRRIIDEFFSQGFSIIAAGANYVYAAKNNYTDQELDPETIRRYLEQLRRLVSG